MLYKESKLYQPIPIAKKYAILEAMRLELDRLYREDRPTYDRYLTVLKPNTWNALEENWKLWNPVPKSHAVWEGPNMRLVYRPAHLAFKHRGGVANAVNIKTHLY